MLETKTAPDVISPNAKQPVPSTGHPGGSPPKTSGNDGDSYGHPFDAYWFGFYMNPLGDHQIDVCDGIGWSDEFAQWTTKQGLFFTDRFAHRFIIGKADSSTRRRVDLSRREFFAVQRHFEFLINKYEFRLAGMLSYSRKSPGHPAESYQEFYWNNRVYIGDSIGRPYRYNLPTRTKKRRSNPKP